MITKIMLINTSITSHFFFFFFLVVRQFKVVNFQLITFRVYNAVLLTIISML